MRITPQKQAGLPCALVFGARDAAIAPACSVLWMPACRGDAPAQPSSVPAPPRQVMYLSSRAISQANITREYLHSLVQGGHRMPTGPVIISPHGLLPSLYREMILRRPHEFKIACLQVSHPPAWQGRQVVRLARSACIAVLITLALGCISLSPAHYPPSGCLRSICRPRCSPCGFIMKPFGPGLAPQDIRALFPPDWNPFYAGLGNRDTDVISYKEVGVPLGRIFVINPKGEIRKASSAIQSSTWSSLAAINSLVYEVFPPIRDVEAPEVRLGPWPGGAIAAQWHTCTSHHRTFLVELWGGTLPPSHTTTMHPDASVTA